MPEIRTSHTLKSTREALCAAAAALGQHGKTSLYDAQMDALNALIADIDRQRPLGANGKHGDRHTPTCGCDDVEPSPESAPLTDAELAAIRGHVESWREIYDIQPREHMDIDRLLAEVDRLRAELAETRSEGSRLHRSLRQTARQVEADEYVRQLRALPGWCRACPPGCADCLGPDCECYEHEEAASGRRPSRPEIVGYRLDPDDWSSPALPELSIDPGGLSAWTEMVDPEGEPYVGWQRIPRGAIDQFMRYHGARRVYRDRPVRVRSRAMDCRRCGWSWQLLPGRDPLPHDEAARHLLACIPASSLPGGRGTIVHKTMGSSAPD